jgi:ribosomal protein L1
MRPAAAKGVFLEKAVVSSTMGPGIMLSIEADVRAATH